jgi:hypothetical protein
MSYIDKAKDAAGDAWDKTKDVAADAVDKAREVAAKVDDMLAEHAEKGGIVGSVAGAAHKVVDKLDDDDTPGKDDKGGPVAPPPAP